jgi:allophanate hydrolase subunit 1
MGEQGLVVELGNTIDPMVNAGVHRLAAALKRKPVAGIRETAPTYRSLLILLDPLLLPRKM